MKEEIAYMSDEDEMNELNKIIRSKKCIVQLKTELHQHTQHTDEKVSFFIIMRLCLNEIILSQR